MADGNEESTLLSSSSPEEDADEIVISAGGDSPTKAYEEDKNGVARAKDAFEAKDASRRGAALFQLMNPVFEVIDDERRKTFAGDVCVWLVPGLLVGMLLGSIFFLTFTTHTLFAGIMLNIILSVTFLFGIIAVWLRRGWSFFLYGLLGILSALLLLTTSAYLGKYFVSGILGLLDASTTSVRETTTRYENALFQQGTRTVDINGKDVEVPKVNVPEDDPIVRYGEYWLWRVDSTFSGDTEVWGGTQDYTTWRDRHATRLPPNPPGTNQYLMETSLSFINVGVLKGFTGRTYAVWWSHFPFTKWPLTYDFCKLNEMLYENFRLPTPASKTAILQKWRQAVLRAGITKNEFYECIYFLDNTSQVLVYQGFHVVWVFLLLFFMVTSSCSLACFCAPSVASCRAFGRAARGSREKAKRKKRLEEVAKRQIGRETIEDEIRRDMADSAFLQSDTP